MSRMHDETISRILDALRAAATSGQICVLRDVQADMVLLHEEHVLPKLLHLCTSGEAGQNLPLLNGAWKLLLSVASLSNISSQVYSRILLFMLSQLHHYVFSHDWSDGRKIKLAAFVASHVVSAVRAHPYYAACDTALVGAIIELHSIACLTVATSKHVEAAQQLHQSIVVRFLTILETMGSACIGSQPLSAEAHLRLLLQCLDGPPLTAAAELPTLCVDAGFSVTALATMLATVRSYQVSDREYLETLFSAFLLWVPDMHLVFSGVGDHEGEAATLALCDEELAAYLSRRVMRHAKNLPPAMFFARRDNIEAAESLSEVNLNVQLLLLLRDLACRSVEAVRHEGWCDFEAASSGGSSLLRCRVFGLLLTALLVPNDASVAFVLLVWEAVLNRLSNTDRESLSAELFQLGEEQLSALRELPPSVGDQATCLRRFLNATAVLLAEISRLLCRSPVLLSDVGSQASERCVSSSTCLSFGSLADVLYHQTCVYQWWNEKSTPREEMTVSAGAEANMLQDELQAMFTEWKQQPFVEGNSDRGYRFCELITFIPGRVKSILQHSISPHSITVVLLVITRVLQSAVEMVGPFHALCVCARFVAAELLAVLGLVPSEDPTLLACVRRLVDISFGVTEDGLEVQVKGILQYHAAVCLRNFIQCNTVVPLDKLRLSEAVSAALMSLLQGTDLSDTEVSMRDCEGLLSIHVEAWKSLVLRFEPVTTSSQMTGCPCDSAMRESCLSSQSGTDCHEGRFLLSLQRCEDTVRSVLRWLETGRALQPSEEKVLLRLEQLVRDGANMTSLTHSSTVEPVCSSSTRMTEEVQKKNMNLDIIVD